MMDALKSYSGEESASEDHSKKEDEKRDQEDEDEPVGLDTYFYKVATFSKTVEVKGQHLILLDPFM